MSIVASNGLSRLFGAASLSILSFAAMAQGIPEDRNINMIGINPPTAVDGVPDTGLKQQNEPACAMKPSNPLQILCAFNDYRGVDDPLIGDAWEGYSYSINGGQTWFSDLLPGHPGDSPNIGLSFAADPQVVAAPGVALISYIAADRGEDAQGGLFLQRMLEVNREAGAPWVPADQPIEVASGDADNFIDKPYMLMHPAPAGSGTVTVNATLDDGTAVSQEVPAASIYIAYTVFSGTVEDANLMSKILIARSDNYGATWETTVLANSTCELPGQGHCKDKGKGHKKGKGRGHSKRKDVIQSASLAAYGDNVCAVWRRFEDLDNLDAIMASCSSDRGETFAPASELSVVPDFTPFDQGTTEATFRTNSYPVITHDGSQFYAFWASRRITSTPFFARIVYSTSVDGSSWTTPVMLDDFSYGHQFMPSVAAARGTIQLAWYDTRNNLFQADFIQDLPGEGAVADEDSEKIIRNQGDIRTAQFVNGVLTPSVQVSRYIEGALIEDGPVEQLEFNFMNDRIFKQGTVPFAGDYPHVAAPLFRLEDGEWVSNTGPSADERPVDFLISWSDTRDVRGNVWNDLVAPTVYTPADQMPMMAEADNDADSESATASAAEAQLANVSDDGERDSSEESVVAARVADAATEAVRADAEPDPAGVYGVCVPGTNADRSRNQNVYSSVVRPGVSIDSPSSSKPTGAIQRAHVVWVSNNESSEQTYTLTIDNQPPDEGANGRASFLQVPVAPFSLPFDDTNGLLTEIDVTIDPNSTIARTVYVTSQEDEPEINVSVSDGGTVIFGTIKLNGDILSPDVQNPDVQNPDVQNPDIQNAEVHNPDVQNVVITRVKNPDVQNPDVQNPDVQNPDVQNPDVQNPDVQNPDIQNPDVQNTSLDGSSTDNPDLANDTLTDAEKEEGYTDITYEVTNDGNTTTSFNLDAFVADATVDLEGKTQLFATRTHVTETSRDCVQGKLVQNQVIFNEINPDLSLFSGNSDDGVFGDGSAYIAPGETILVTLRVWGDPDLFEFVPESVGVQVQSQSCDSADKTAFTTDCDPPLVTGTPPLVEFDFENASPGDQFPMPSSTAGAVSSAVFSGTKDDREVIAFGSNNVYRSSALFPTFSGGYFVYLAFTTTEPLELGSLRFLASQNDTDQLDKTFDVLLSPVNAAAPAEGAFRIPALDDYTKIAEFDAQYFTSFETIDLDLTGNVLFPGTYYIALAASPNSGINVGTTQLFVDDVQLRGLVADSFSAKVDFEFIPPLAFGANIAAVNSELERYGVQWEAQGGLFQLFNMSGFPPLSGAGIAFNSTDNTGQNDGTHTAHFVCPDGSGRLATVTSASIDVADTEAITVSASSFDINGVLLETVSLQSPPTGTLLFSSGPSDPIASIVITDSGGDGHFVDNLNYDGFECLPIVATTFTENVIGGDDSIFNGGSFVVANTMNLSSPVSITSPVTVNFVTFGLDQSGFTNQAGTGGWLTSSGDFSTDPVDTEWSADLDTVLSGNQFMPFGTTHGELTIPGLTPGTRYRLQLLFSNDLNTTANNIEVTAQGETYILNDWQPDAINLIVEFTATSPSVVVEFDAGVGATPESGRAHLNAYAVHDITFIIL